VAAAAAGAVALHAAGPHARAEAARDAPPPLRLSGVLPAWVAPGVPVSLSGWTAAREPVLLLADGRVLARARSGRFGAFRLRFAAPEAPRRYRLTVGDGGRTVRAGVLVVRPVVLEAVGDITFGEQVGPSLERYGAAYPWRHVARTLRGADITTGNLETSVSARGVAAVKQYVFRGPPAALRPVGALAGFDVLTLANNHAVDYGRDALRDTVAAVRAAGMQTIGAGADSLLARRPAIVDAGGLRVALLGYSDVNPAGFTAGAGVPGTARADPAAIAADVRAARRRADVVVCFFHWGVELHARPDGRQRQLADTCLNAGASVVLGAHPHVFGPVTHVGHVLVAWTLGNFVFPSSGATAHTGILRVELDRRGVRSYRVIPVAIDGFTPRPGGR